LLDEVKALLKVIFEDMNKIKIMHACRQDATALMSCMGIKLKNVFDTAGCEQYFEQKHLYRQMHEHNETYEHTLRKIHTCKSPGLNQVL
jgi:ribonuclease D